MSIKKEVSRGKGKKPATVKGKDSNEGIIAQDKLQLVPPFDVITQMEEWLGINANIGFKNEK